MQVLLDGRRLDIARPSLAHALEAAAASAESQGRIIVEAKADGVALSDDNLSNPSDQPSQVQELHLISAEPRSLVRVTILDAVDALDAARSQQSQASELIQAGDTEGALKLLQQALLTWQAVRDVVSRSAGVLGLDLDTLALGEGKDFGSATQQLLGQLTGVRTALGQQDWSALSDIVGFDLDAQAEAWKGLLLALADHVASLPAPRSGTGNG